MIRIATAGFQHESNTFSSVPASLDQWQRAGILDDAAAIRAEYATSQSTLAGFFAAAAEDPGIELVPIDGPKPVMREDTVKISMGTTDIRFRPEYRAWSMEFDIVFNGRAISPEQIVNLVNIAGFGIGIGDWRPERSGQFGMFHVATEGEV